MTLHVAVIGAGIVGAATAVELVRDGCRVTVVEPGEPGGAQAASFGNGAWISPASVVPMSTPGLWRRVPGYLTDPTGPFTIRPAALPRLLPWLMAFVRAGATLARVEATARALRSLLADGPERHARLAAEAGVPELIVRSGLLYAYPDRAAFERDALAWRPRRDTGVRWTELEGDAVGRFEPALDPRYRFAALVEDGAHCIDPGAYVAALVACAERAGASRVRARATGFALRAGRLAAVRTDRGDLACDRAVIAAGIRSKPLARAAGDRVLLESERGYHVVVSDPEAAPAIPVMPSDGKMANTRVRAGLRASGQVELASTDAPPDWRRADVLLEHLHRTYPGLPRGLAPDRVTRWMGHRPSTPDGLPVIGPASGSRDIVHAFGHGHVGLAAAPITGRLAADLAAGREPGLDLAPFSAARFG